MTTESMSQSTELTELAKKFSAQELKSARRAAMQYAYALDLNQQIIFNAGDFDAFAAQVSLDPLLKSYVKLLVDRLTQLWEQINILIERNAHKWKIFRIAKVDLAIIRVCAVEVIDRKELAIEVIVADAAEMGKENSSEGSGSFVHGVLHGITVEVRGKL